MVEHLKLWKRPDSYMGPEWNDYYVVMSQHRDSDTLTRSNWRVALRRLEAEAERLGDVMFDPEGDSFLQIVSDSHWAVGWIEFIYLHKSAPEIILETADSMVEQLTEYPVLDDDDWGILETEEAESYWSTESVRGRIELIKRAYPFGGVSIFAARRAEFPGDPDGSLYEMMRD